MRYRTTTPYDRSRRNESRADRVEWALAVSTDREGEREPAGVATDVSDLLANVRHFCDRAGLDYGEVDGHAYLAYSGDHRDGPVAQRDTERFPGDDEPKDPR